MCNIDLYVHFQHTFMISPLQDTPRCVSYVRLEQEDGQTTPPTDALLLGDDKGCVTLMSIDVKDLTEYTTGVEVRPGKGQDRRVVYVEPKHLTL